MCGRGTMHTIQTRVSSKTLLVASVPRAKSRLPQRKQPLFQPVLAFVNSDNGHDAEDVKGDTRLPLSMFTPYTQLPPAGKTAHAADISCDPNVQRCKTLVYTYESKCNRCSGTGFVRNGSHVGHGSHGGHGGHGSHSNHGRHASLCTCLACHGLGYVRYTTSRYNPDNAEYSKDVFTLVRPEEQRGPKDQQKK